LHVQVQYEVGDEGGADMVEHGTPVKGLAFKRGGFQVT
jgi:hypothetical protein